MSESVPVLPFEREEPLDLPPMYLRLQAERPIVRVRTPAGDPAWLVTRYEDVRALFADERLGRSHPEPERAPRVTQAEFLGGATSGYETEKEDHARMRRLMAPPFSARRVQGLQPRIQRLVDGLLDQLAASGPPADLHETLSVLLPCWSSVTCSACRTRIVTRSAGTSRTWPASTTARGERRGGTACTTTWPT